MGAPPKSDVPLINSKELPEDSTRSLWQTQQLAGRPARIFYNTGSQGDGQETTALTAITQLVHHGMLFVPIGYTFGDGMFEMNEVKGGSPYGAGTYAGGDGSRQLTKLEMEQAFTKASILPPLLISLKKNEAIRKLGY
ncbi:putative NAD(P)H dehydrogenase (quinone) FQR1-like [Arachis hypogaea]|nr:putative NAD(P)H dehydrogenase (quinone) FQR1-like [Arachis hypogaea]